MSSTRQINKILVTGNSGTIGTALCETLLNRGFDVVGVDIIKPNKWNEKVKNDTFNIASGESIPILDVAQNIKNMLNGNNQIKIRENRTGEVLRCIVDISKAKEKLGYNPHIKINEGLMRSVKWYEKMLYNNLK